MADKWDAAAERAWQVILADVRKMQANGETQETIAKSVGVSQKGVVSQWLAGTRKAVNTSFASMNRYLANLGHNPTDFLPEDENYPSMRRTGVNSPSVPIIGDDLVTVPVVSSVGAGTPWNHDASEVERYISVPKEYDLENVVSLRVEGDSMEPTIMKGGFIGVVPFTAPLVEGEMYVVHLPYFGDVVKRVRMGDNVGEIVLLSDNPHYPPQHVPLDGHDDLIRGRVIWSISSYVKN